MPSCALFRVTLLALAVTLMTTPGTARAEDEEEHTATYAVQNRRFKLGHELQVAVGMLPLNAFTKGVTVGGGYTYHFSDAWAWEIGHFVYSFDMRLFYLALRVF